MRTAPVVTLSIADRSALERLEKQDNALSALHAQMVKLAAEGRSNKEIAAISGVNRKTVARWRRRFLSSGAAGIEDGRARLGRPPTISADQVKQILAKFENKRWTTRMVARAIGVSAATVRRIWKLQGVPLRTHIT